MLAWYSQQMRDIEVTNMPSAVHQAVRARAAEQDLTVSAYVLDLIRRDLAVPSRRQWAARVQSRQPVDVPAVAAIDVIRAEREDELRRIES
jgi:hypothetical protein